jgi:hypothetical protein
MEFTDSDGTRWKASTISHGRTSDYLNPKVHRPIVEFRCLDRRLPRRYAKLPPERDSLEAVPPGELRALLARAKVH